MKNAFILIILFCFTCCTSKINNAEGTNNASYLDSIIPYMDTFTKDTAIIFDWNGNKNRPASHYEDNPISHIVGKFIDSTQIFALNYNHTDTLINFYRFEQGKWKIIGSHTAIADSMTFLVGFIDMDNDKYNEIIVRTPPNMNGNTCQDVFRYSAEKDSVELAGSFSTDFEIKKEKKTVEVTYEGSWWMTNSKTLYKWHNNKLIPEKSLELSIKDGTLECEDYILEYFEKSDTLTSIFKVPYKGKKYKDIWDNFFEKAGNIEEE